MSNKFISKKSLLIPVLLVFLASCGSDDNSTTTESTVTEAPSTEAPETSTTNPAAANMHGKRYCEILLLNLKDDGIYAEVFNTYPLNDCPDDQWKAIDTAAIALAEGVVFASPNGPRYWAMDSVVKADMADVFSKTFGEVEMNRYASVYVGANPADLMIPYSPHAVNRKAAFTFNAGTTVYMLHDAEGKTYVMQSWSQQVDPALTEDDLLTLADRLQLPEGWTYDYKTLTQDFVVETRA
ncbi:MAG: hypothetical protein RL628_1728, partial [Actinomycetota bacterium]